MATVYGSELIDKEVMASDGRHLGETYQLTMKLKGGSLEHLIVEPADEYGTDGRFDIDENGRYRIPTQRITGVSDYITVE